MRAIFTLSILWVYFLLSANAQSDTADIGLSSNPLVFDTINITPELRNAFLKLHNLRQTGDRENNSSAKLFTIIHIGDSHVQGDYFTGAIRKELQQYFGNAGQGILFPYPLAKSYGPRGTKVQASGTWIGMNTMSKNLSEPLGLCGYGAFTKSSGSSITLDLKEKFEGSPFKKLSIWHSVDSSSFPIKLDSAFDLINTVSNSEGWGISTYQLSEPRNSFTLSLEKQNFKHDHFGFYGFELDPDKTNGIRYHHCGVVGAQFTHLIKNAPFALGQIKALKPDLIIFSFGTNEAYNTGLDTATYRISVEKFIGTLKTEIPELAIILTTAPDTRSQGRIPPHQVDINEKLKLIAKNSKLSIFDLNHAMGGWGSLYTWHHNNLTLTDKLHFKKEGYGLQGNLLTLSFLMAYNKIILGDTIDLGELKETIKPYYQVLLSNQRMDGNDENSSVDDLNSPRDIRRSNEHKKEEANIIDLPKMPEKKGKSGKSKYKIHIVKKGQNVSLIASKYHVSINSILRVNHLRRDQKIKPGQKLLIPRH